MVKVLLILAIGLVAGWMGMVIGNGLQVTDSFQVAAPQDSTSQLKIMSAVRTLPEGYVYHFDRQGLLVAVQSCNQLVVGIGSLLEYENRGLTRIELCG